MFFVTYITLNGELTSYKGTLHRCMSPVYVYGPCYVFLMYVCVNKVALLRCIWIAKKVRNIL